MKPQNLGSATTAERSTPLMKTDDMDLPVHSCKEWPSFEVLCGADTVGIEVISAEVDCPDCLRLLAELGE